MMSGENFKILEELAEVLGGVVGASRAVTDAGWQDLQPAGRTNRENCFTKTLYCLWHFLELFSTWLECKPVV